MSIRISQNDLDRLMKQDVNELLRDLAIADAGADGQQGIALDSLSTLKGVMSAEGADGLEAFDVLGLGRRIFNRVWPLVKDVVCALYSKNDGEGELKGWVTTLATAVLAAASVSSPVAIIVAVIAIKMGLDRLCGADSEATPA